MDYTMIPDTKAEKERLRSIAKKVVDFLRSENLPIWEVEEVLVYAKLLLGWEILK